MGLNNKPNNFKFLQNFTWSIEYSYIQNGLARIGCYFF